MDPGNFVLNLFGKTVHPSVTLPHPLRCVSLRMKASDMDGEGWLQRLCVARLAEHGDEALQLLRPTGEAIAVVQSTAAAAVVEAPPVVAESEMGDLFE